MIDRERVLGDNTHTLRYLIFSLAAKWMPSSSNSVSVTPVRVQNIPISQNVPCR